jgi:hypothetical protein
MTDTTWISWAAREVQHHQGWVPCRLWQPGMAVIDYHRVCMPSAAGGVNATTLVYPSHPR